MQIDHFVQCILDRTQSTISSFETALETDLVVSKMIQNEKSNKALDYADEQAIISKQTKGATRKESTASLKKPCPSSLTCH